MVNSSGKILNLVLKSGVAVELVIEASRPIIFFSVELQDRGVGRNRMK